MVPEVLNEWDLEALTFYGYLPEKGAAGLVLGAQRGTSVEGVVSAQSVRSRSEYCHKVIGTDRGRT